MIKLDIQPYCQNCLNFEADVESPKRAYAGSDIAYQTDTIVRCERRKYCENIKRYLEREMGKEEPNETH